MNLNFIPVNGKNPNFDYTAFEESARKILPPTCNEATIILINNFPALVSSESTIDLIIVIALKDEPGNYYSIRKGSKSVYMHNQIIPVTIIQNLQDAVITIDDENYLLAGDQPLDFTNEINSIRYGLNDYLVRKCNFNSKELYIKPMVYIKNDKTIFHENILVCKKFDFKSLMTYVAANTQDILCSYKTWKSEAGYYSIEQDFQRVVHQASFDSEIGFLSMKKIQRISKQLSNEREIFNHLNKHLIVVNGKAGTGKTSELVLLIMRCISNGKNTQFLTYNKLLVFDVSRTIWSYYLNKTDKRIEDEKVGLVMVSTLHRFFFRLSFTLGIQHLLSEKRVVEVINLLATRTATIKNIILEYFNNHSIVSIEKTDIEILKSKIQNHKSLDIATKEVGVDFVNFLKRKIPAELSSFENIVADFTKFKSSVIGRLISSHAFIIDYYGVLRNIHLAVTNPDAYIDKYEIEKKFDLLAVPLNFKDNFLEQGKEGRVISRKKLKSSFKRRISGNKIRGTVFIDEAQDCHPLERDILFAIFGSENIIISSGGKEQLIRHVELCDWTKSNDKRIGYKEFHTVNKSFRIKKSVLHFCNFVAEKYKVKLKLDPIETEDDGELIFDFRSKPSKENVLEIFKGLSLKGTINKCTALESILILIDSSSKSIAGINMIDEENMVEGKINEYNNIEDSLSLIKSDWEYKGMLEENCKLLFWDGAVDSKSDLKSPYPTETRMIYYESCRGLEAWSVACFKIDSFFNQKKEDPDAEKYLMDDIFLQLQNEERKNMFAATWALMAITRAIDTLYLQFSGENCDFTNTVNEYIKQNPTAAKVLR